MDGAGQMDKGLGTHQTAPDHRMCKQKVAKGECVGRSLEHTRLGGMQRV